ncbi:MAG TPA: hypothetical protein VHL78_11555 [Actinomycetota bacterium]|nr:hypothetical protein [Actinomycetota bacterium]
MKTPSGSGRQRPGRAGLSRGEIALLVVAGLAFLHHVDHVLRGDNSGWPFTPDVTAFTVSLLIYPIFVADFLLLRPRPRLRAGIASFLFVALLAVHTLIETPAMQYGTWAAGRSSVPGAVGNPNLFSVASPALGALSVAVSALLSIAVLVAVWLLAREASSTAKGVGDG